MLDAGKAGALLRHHFDTVTDEEFIENVRHFDPEMAQEMWGNRTTAEILAQRADSASTHDDRAPTSVPGKRIVATAARRTALVRRQGVRGLFAALGRSVLKIFS